MRISISKITPDSEQTSTAKMTTVKKPVPVTPAKAELKAAKRGEMTDTGTSARDPVAQEQKQVVDKAFTAADLAAQNSAIAQRDIAQQGLNILQNPSQIYDPAVTGGLTEQYAAAGQAGLAAKITQQQYQRAATEYRDALNQQLYGGLHSNKDYASMSQGDKETAVKGYSGLNGKDLKLYSQMYYRGNDPTLSENPLHRDPTAFATDEQAADFFYLWNKKGPAAARAYYNDYLLPSLNQQKTSAAEGYARDIADKAPVAASGLSVATNLAGSAGIVDIALQNMTRRFGGDKSKPIDYNTAAQLPSRVTNEIRQEVSKNIEKAHPNALIAGVNVASFLYQTGMSMADSGMMILFNKLGVPEAATLAAMGGSAGTAAIRDAKERGATDSQALAEGMAYGIAEAVFEKLSLDQILNASKPSTLRKAFKELLTQGFVEGSEEVFTTLANTVADDIIMRDKSEIETQKRRLMEGGVSETEAEKAAAKQWVASLVSDFIGGLISGGVMGGGNQLALGLTHTASDVKDTLNILSQNREDIRQAQTEQQVPEAPQPKIAPVITAATRNTDPLRYATDKVQSGNDLTGGDIRAVQDNAEAMQTLRDAGVLVEKIAPGAEGREQIRNAVQDYAAQATTINEEEMIGNEDQNRERAAEERQNTERSEERDTGMVPRLRFADTYRDVRDTKRQIRSAVESRAAASAAGLNQRSAAEIGLKNGTDTRNITELTDDVLTTNQQDAVKRYANEGVNLHFINGFMEQRADDGSLSRARGWINNDGTDIWVQADHPRLSWEYILEHEDLHKKIKNSPALREQILDDIRNDPNVAPYFKELADRYAKAYADTNLSPEDIYEEILCDYRAGFDALYDYDRKRGKQLQKTINLSIKRNAGARQTSGTSTQRLTLPSKTTAQAKTGQGEESNTDLENRSQYDTLKKRNDVLFGSRGQAWTEDNLPISFTYAVVPLDSLVISNDEYGGVNKNYPAELQPRDRSRVSGQAQVQRMANGLVPQKLADSPTAQNGAPIVRGDGIVIGGNGRSAAIAAAYKNGKASQYEAFIRNNAQQYGIEAQSLPNNPVLVRIADNVENWQDLARQLNVSSTAVYSASEKAQTDAAKIGDIIDLLVPTDSGSINNTENRDFIQAFVNRVVPKNERGDILTASGLLSQNGLERALNAIFYYAYGDAALLSQLSEDIDPDMKNVINALAQSASAVAALQSAIESEQAYDIPVRETLIDALSIYRNARQNRQTVREYLDQGDMLRNSDESAAQIAGFIEQNKNSAKQMRMYFNALTQEVMDYGDPAQGSMFGGETYDIQGAIRGAARRYEEATGREFRYTDAARNREKSEVAAGSRGSIEAIPFTDDAGTRQGSEALNSGTGEGAQRNEISRFSREITPQQDTDGNSLSRAQQEYFKNSAIRDDEGQLRVVYHGTDADFTVFDRSKGRSTMDIQGSFFSPWDIDAGGYGSKVRAYYLNIKNPAPESVAYRALNRFKGQNNAGVLAREYLEKQGYDGVNNNDEEYIAFYPEQIKRIDNKNPTESKDTRYSREITPQQDADYMSAVKRGDTETAQRMVAEAAKNAGYTEMWAHGSPNAMFTSFDLDKANGARAVFLSDLATASQYADTTYRPLQTRLIGNSIKTVSDALSEIRRIDDGFHQPKKTNSGYTIGRESYTDAELIDYANQLRNKRPGGVYSLYVNPGKCLVVDAEGTWWNRINSEYGRTTDQIGEWARKHGYDSVEIDKVFDGGFGSNISQDVLLVFDGNRLKSADPVTYDDSGNVIPLSERFDPKQEDIRYSIEHTRTMPWEEQVKGYFSKNGTIKSSDSLYLGTSGKYLAGKGVSDSPFFVPLSVVNKAVRKQKGSRSAHVMSEDDIYALNEGMEKPAAIIHNPNRNAIVFLTGIDATNGGTIILSFDLNNDLYGENAHKATSIHSRGSIEGLLNNLGKDATIYVVNKNKLDQMLPGIGIQSSKLLAKVEFVPNTVVQANEKVNPSGESYSRELDPTILSELNRAEKNGDVIHLYRTMQILDIDGQKVMMSPMNARRGKGKDVKWDPPFAILNDDGSIKETYWSKADESPELRDKSGKFPLKKGVGFGDMPVAYNPYMHGTSSMLNDQFSTAYKRPNLITVEVIVPKSEEARPYHAEGAKDPVGWVDWKAGSVSTAKAQAGGEARNVFLSRWIKPVRIIPDSEVADHIINTELKGTDIKIPANVVTPSMLEEIRKISPERIAEPESRYADDYNKYQNGSSRNSIELDPGVIDTYYNSLPISKKEQPERKISKTRTNTYELSGFFDKVINDLKDADEGMYAYDVVHEKQTTDAARERLLADFDGAVEDLINKEYWTAEDVDTAMGILHVYKQRGNLTGDYTDFLEFSQIVHPMVRQDARALQAMAKYSRTAAEEARKAAQSVKEAAGQLTPAEEKRVKQTAEDVKKAAKDSAKEAAEETVKAAAGELKDSHMTRDALNLIREIYDNLNVNNKEGNYPVKAWTTLTGDELARRIASRFSDKRKQRTTMQLMLSDLLRFAQEHALPERQKVSGRTATDIISDYLNNRNAYAQAWGEAQAYLRAVYSEDEDKLNALDSFLNATISQNADPQHVDRMMFDAILESADTLGITEKQIKDITATGVTEGTVRRIADELVRQVKSNLGADFDESFETQLRDAVRRYINGVALSMSADQRGLRLQRMENRASRALGIKMAELLTQSKQTKAAAANSIAQYLIGELDVPATDAAIIADAIAQDYIDRLAQKADARLQKMFEQRPETTRIKKSQRQKLLELIRLGGLTNQNVEDAVVDALGLGKISRAKQREIMTNMAQFADTFDAMEAGDLEGLRNLIRRQAAYRKTKLSRMTERFLNNEGDEEYLRSFAMSQLASIAEDYRPRGVGQKISTWQTVAHLLNPKTGLRNVGSNEVFDIIATAANNVSMVSDMIMGLFTGKRHTIGLETGWLSKAKRQGAREGGRRSALEVSLDVNFDESGGTGKYGNKTRRTFSMAGSNALGKIMSHLEKTLGYELNVTDEIHKGGIRRETLESLARYVEKGYLTQEQANEIAEQEALYRSFQDDTAVGTILRTLKEGFNVIGFGDNGKTGKAKAMRHTFGLGDLITKYTQVPGALIHRAIEFSPLGYAKALYNIGQLANEARKGNDVTLAQRKAALAIGQATTGTGLILLFRALAKMGLLLRGSDKDKDKNAMALKAGQGLSGTQLNLDGLGRAISGGNSKLENGDTLIDLGFLEPLDSLMTIAALMSDNKDFDVKTDGKDTIEGIYKALENTSAMQTFSDVMNTIRYHDPENDLPLGIQIPVEVASSGVSGFVPGPVRHVAQAMDTDYRDQYRSQNVLAQMLDRTMNSIPGVREKLAPKITPLGQEKQYQAGPVARVLNAVANPAAISVYNSTRVTDELDKLYDATGDAKIWPERNAPYTVTIGDKITLTPDERTEYQTVRGGTVRAGMEQLLRMSWYTKLSPDTRAEVVNWLENFANYVAKVNFADGRRMNYSSSTYAPYLKEMEDGKTIGQVVESQYSDLAAAINAGIPEKSYTGYKTFASTATADKDADGKTISGSKRDKVLDYIDNIPGLTIDQKDILYYDAGYAESKIDEAPWHYGSSSSSGLRLPSAPAENQKSITGLRLPGK